MDFRQPEVLLVKKVHEFEVRKTPLEALVDMGLNGEYNLKELMRLVSLGAACTRSDPKLRPNTTQILKKVPGQSLNEINQLYHVRVDDSLACYNGVTDSTVAINRMYGSIIENSSSSRMKLSCYANFIIRIWSLY
ncbi:hypothetical protein JHK86_010439 [Glycine max]|nr:hypothetical protein JHK86_010439 [Glycine max]